MAKRAQRRSRRQGASVNPMYGLLLFVGMGMGTWRVVQGLRQLLLWLVLLGAGLLYIEARPVKAGYSLRAVGWGSLIGAIVSVPVLFFMWTPLQTFAFDLYAATDALQLVYLLCFVAAPVEELYFRGFAQREVGLPIAVALYAGAAFVLFLPNPGVSLATVLVMMAAYGLMGFVQGYVYRRYGLSAAIAGHVAINLLVLILPALIGMMTAVG